jgi:hypothetical protein
MRRTLFAVLLALLAACSSSTGPTADVRVQTAQRTYGLNGNPVVPVQFTVTNQTSAEVALAACGGTPAAMLQRRDGSQWATVTSGICPAVLEMAPIRLAPGATASGVVEIHNTPGTFRIGLPHLELPSESPRATSPTFEVWAQLPD